MAWRLTPVEKLTPSALLEFLRAARLQGVRSIKLGSLHAELIPPSIKEIQAAREPVELIDEVKRLRREKEAADRNQNWSNEGPEDLDV